ncbi:MAG: alkaline phosphatase family protein [Rikenellaceae bacterium]|nr:alkaline phosphatase family protein [Rikenellaceae bacterium]
MNWKPSLFSMILLGGCFSFFSGHAKKPERTILFTIDGMTSGMEERIDMPNFSALIREGVWYKEVHLPLPAHPVQSDSYPWSCSIPNPVLMSGTIFIGQPGVSENLIQSSFKERPTAFTVNSGSYAAIREGFSIYRQVPKGEMDPVYRDEAAVEAMKAIILEHDPEFMRIHCQGLGSSGSRTQTPGKPYTDDIWHPESPWRLQARHTDRVLGEFVQWLKAHDLWENTVLIVMGDHGQADAGWHAPYAQGSRTTQMVVAGKNIRRGVVFDYAEIIDLAPTVAWLHGLAPPRFSDGRILEELIEDHGGESVPLERRPWMKLLNNALLEHHVRQPECKEDPELDIEMIARWHEGACGADYPQFVWRQQEKVFGGSNHPHPSVTLDSARTGVGRSHSAPRR